MTCIVDNPEEFAKTALAGFASVYSRTVRPVIGGVVRSTTTPEGKVAVVVGGGYGHNCGMSQWGAKAMAQEHGKTYEEIISFYYTGAYVA